MGATKIDIKQIADIRAIDLRVLDFELEEGDACHYVIDHAVHEGEMILIKASFKVGFDPGNNADQGLVRRRVVPFITRVVEAVPEVGGKYTQVKSVIEKILADDRRFFFKKYFADTDTAALDLEFEAKHIRFTAA